MTNASSQQVSSLTDSHGTFKILAIDHVNALRKQLRQQKNGEEVSNEEIAELKSSVIAALKSGLTGVVIDYTTYMSTPKTLYEPCGVLIRVDDTWSPAPWNKKERITEVIKDIDFSALKQAGATGVKLTLYYRHDSSDETKKFQEDLTKQYAKLCAENGLVYCLEPWWYALKDDELDVDNGKRTLAERRPRIVIEPLKELGKPEYGVDIFKLEYPIDSKFYRFAHDTSNTDVLYSRNDVESMCSEISRLVAVPWVIMSSGVTAPQFTEYLDIAMKQGAAGYICGQAIWQESVRQFPNKENIQNALKTVCQKNLELINSVLNS